MAEPKDVHRMEQTMEAVAELARYHSQYYMALLASGQHTLVALEMTKQFIAAQAITASHTGSK